jgi:hypothetical protein
LWRTPQHGALLDHIRVEIAVLVTLRTGTMESKILILTQKMIECKVPSFPTRVLSSGRAHVAMQVWERSSRSPIRTNGASSTSPPLRRISTSQPALNFRSLAATTPARPWNIGGSTCAFGQLCAADPVGVFAPPESCNAGADAPA